MIHRDIKPENIIVKPNNKVKLLDFGLSKGAKDVMKNAGCTGTPFYMAPEVIKGSNYDTMCDMWSCGVLLYIFMSGFMPFPARDKEELFIKIIRGQFTFKHKEFEKVSEEGKDLITKLLHLSPSHRLTAK